MFTIEDLIEKIYEPKTKELFRDVYTSYTQGQYRATVVMLWTVVICDFIYKLQYLKDIYNDATAIDILEKIADKQKKNPKNPEWENFLIDTIFERTNFIDEIEKENLNYLQKQRNLCAHPIITNENILFKPTKELTRSLIRIALDSVLLKSTLLSKRYVDTILEDLEKRIDDFFPWDDNFERYCQNRYLNHLNKNQILKLFKLLWRMTFSPHNDREEQNSFTNLQLLKFIFKKYKSQCIDYMRQDIEAYSYDKSNNKAKEYFNGFIIENYNMYSHLSEQTKALFESEIRQFPSDMPYFFISQKTFEEYLSVLNEEFNNRQEVIEKHSIWLPAINLRNQAKERGLENMLYNMFINWYASSINFNEADILFDELIKNNLKEFSLEQIIELIKLSSQNNQTYNRGKATQDHKYIVQRYLKLDGSYDNIHNTPFEDLYIELGGCPF